MIGRHADSLKLASNEQIRILKMLHRFILYAVLLITLSSCAMLRTKPQIRSFSQRLADFPVSDIPLEGKVELVFND